MFTAINVDAIMLSRRQITSLPPALFTHQSNHLHSLLVGSAMLYAYRFRFPSKQNAKLAQSSSACLYSGCSGLSRTSTEPDPGWPRKTVANACAVVCGWSVTNAVFYDIKITTRCHWSVRRLLVADLPQLDQLTWRTSRHLTRRLHVVTVGAWGRGCW